MTPDLISVTITVSKWRPLEVLVLSLEMTEDEAFAVASALNIRMQVAMEEEDHETVKHLELPLARMRGIVSAILLESGEIVDVFRELG